MPVIPCNHCKKNMFPPPKAKWFICNLCNFRICPGCISKHKGPYGTGTKCSQCRQGFLKATKI